MGRMTENMKSEAVRLYFEENREPDEIARQIGASEKQVKTILGDLKRLEAYRKKSEAAKLRAQICVYESAEEAARHQAALLSPVGGERQHPPESGEGHPRPGGHSDAEGLWKGHRDSVCGGRTCAGHAGRDGRKGGRTEAWR